MRAMLLAAVALAATPALAGGGDPAAAATAWAKLVDQGRYGESWRQAGALFRNGVTKAGWAQMVGRVRQPLGVVVSRRLTSQARSRSLPGAPDGDYDTLHFATVFTHKSSAVETIVLAREPSGWRVDGYFIR
ncbi:MAG TPA: DUF4019 domain-containing protein [Caulobacteraceae bacterium]|jgi:hypothetical protein|nr:DUF4019 domain-containing protein [Caulobacteraceae bacterium]